MAEFCKQCATKLGFEVSDFEGLLPKANEDQGHVLAVLCEGCGHTYVNRAGECVSASCLEKHGVKK